MDKTQKKILYITSRSDIGGGPLSLKWLIESFKNTKKDHLEIFVAAPENQEFSLYFKENSRSFFPLPFRSFSFLTFLKLLFFIKKNNIINIHTMGRGASFYGVFCSLFFYFLPGKIKWLHTFHGLHYGTNYIDLLKKILDKIIFCLFCDAVFVLTSDEKKNALKILSIPIQKIFSIRNYAPDRIREFKKKSSLIDWKKKWNIPKHQIAVGIMARNDLVKGLKTLEKKIQEIEKYFPGKFYFIHGNKMAPEEKGAWGFFLAIDIYLSHSFREGSPLAVFESLELETPCLLSDIPGHREFQDFHLKKDLIFYFNLSASGEAIGQKLLAIGPKLERPMRLQKGSYEEEHLKELLLQYVT